MQLLLANVGSVERNNLKLARKSTGNTVAVSAPDFSLSQVGIDNRRLSTGNPCVDHIVQTGYGKLIGQLRAKIIHDQQVAGLNRFHGSAPLVDMLHTRLSYILQCRIVDFYNGVSFIESAARKN